MGDLNQDVGDSNSRSDSKKVVTRSLVLVLDGVGSFSSLGGSALHSSLPLSIPQVGSFLRQLFFPVLSFYK